jgi:hypothetical protein
MALATPSELREVTGITDAERAAIKAFIQGAVYCWVKNRRGEQFAVRDLVGGPNADWTGTPLYPLYAKHVGQGKPGDEAAEAAGRDLGWLVKSVLAEDKRTFDAGKGGLVSVYRWVEPVAAGAAPDAEPGAAPDPARM